MSTSILQFINNQVDDIKERDNRVLQEINNFLEINKDGISDGLYKNFIVIGNQVTNRFLQIYNVDTKKWKELKKVNKILSTGYQILDDPLRSCFISSYNNTKDNIFLDMIYLLFAGSKFSHYFPYRDNLGYENKMRRTINEVIGKKSYIYKAGTLSGALEMSRESLFENNNLKNRLSKLNDENVLYIMGVIRSKVNELIKVLKNAYIETEKMENTSSTTGDSLPDEESGDILESGSDSGTIEKINILLNENITHLELDRDIMKLVGCDSPECFYIFKRILQNHPIIPVKIMKYYYNYYVDNNYVSMQQMKIDFIQKSFNSKVSMDDKLINDLRDKAKIYLNDYNELGGPKKIIHQMRDIRDKFPPLFKKYCIVHARKILNKI